MNYPNNWKYLSIKECCNVVSGSTPRRNQPEYWGGDIDWVTPKDLSNLNVPILEEAPEKITELGYKSCSTTLLPKGSVLFSSRAPIGLIAIAGRKMCTNQGFKSLVPNQSVDSAYLYWCVRYFTPQLAAQGSGTTFKELSKIIVEKFKIPIPPLEEQKRIAAILDKADSIRRSRQEAIRLTEELLRSTFLDMFGDPVTNPKGWEIKPLIEVIDPNTSITYGIVQAGENAEHGVPYIRTGDIKNGKIVESGLLRTAPEIALKFKRSEVNTGDIVMSIRATVGTVAEVPESLNGANLTQGTAKISPGKEVKGYYLLEYIRSNGCQHWIKRQVKGATFREITLTRLRQMPVMLPCIQTQTKFEQFAKQINDSRLKLESSYCYQNDLFNSLLQRAFRGEL